ncbi:MAG: hydrolase, partial [Bacilli bacterium]|nr:hydrolase [Bacilli bacterium]
MLQTLLFDLDGTLLPLNQDYFTREYLGKLLPLLSHLQDEHQLAKHLWSATNAMIQSNNVDKTNEQVFREVFLTNTGLTEDQVWPILLEFYEGAFG